MVEPELTADLHENIELITGANNQGTVIHLINHSGVRRRTYGPHFPFSGGQLRLHGGASRELKVQALVAGTPLETRAEGNDLLIELPTIELFEVVQFTN
jgi:hypothetical protein